MHDSKDSPSAHEPPALTARPDLIGRVLSDRYRIDAVVAAGSFGAVYRGVHLHMRKEVAIKVLHPEIENFPEHVERFEREAVAGAHVSHPNVAVASDLGKFDGESYFLVQEYVRGETLRQVLDRGRLPVARAARIARQIAAALGAAHRRGIVHRDLKPSNVMLVDGTEDFTKLIDFGFAKVPLGSLPHLVQDVGGADWSKSEAGVVFGTVAYLAPEAALGMRNVTERSDLYALGVLFYESIAGRHPFDVALPAAELFAQHRYTLPPRFAELGLDLDVPGPVESVVQRLLAKDPSERFPDAQAVIDALDAAMGRDRVYRARSNPDSMRPSRWLSAKLAIPTATAVPALPPEIRSRRPLFVAFGALATIGAVVAIVATRPEPPEPAATISAAPPSATAPAPSASTPETFDGRFVREQSAELVRLAPSGDVGEASGALRALIEADARALGRDDVQTAAATLLARLPQGSEITDRTFYALAYKAAGSGLDVLYAAYERFPGSYAARRSESILSLQAVSERASPALRVTWELSRATCPDKPRLFERAATEGDARTLRLLTAMRSPACNARRGECCLRRDFELEKAVTRLGKR
jgi:serine/threonine-protein kinase